MAAPQVGGIVRMAKFVFGGTVLFEGIGAWREEALGVTNVQIGDTTNEHFIASLGVGNFDLCVVAIGDNFQSSLETTALLKDYGAPFVLSRANRDVHAKFLLRNGADSPGAGFGGENGKACSPFFII